MENSEKKRKLTYYQKNGLSQTLSREQLFALMAEDSEQLKRRGAAFMQHIDSYALQDSGKVHVAPIYNDNYTPYHDHDFYEINYVFEGELLEYVDGRQITLRRGELLLMAPEVRHIALPYKRARAYNVLLSQDFVASLAVRLEKCEKENYLSDLVKSSGYRVFHGVHGACEPLIADMHDYLRKSKRKTPYRSLLAECLATELAVRLAMFGCDVYTRAENVLRENLSEEVVGKRILRYIDENHGAVELDGLSRYFGYSTRQIQRLVERYGGLSFSKYVQNVRLAYAGRCLQRTDMPIGEIARVCGFDSTEYFCRWFKKYRGETASSYRKSAKTERTFVSGGGNKIV